MGSVEVTSDFDGDGISDADELADGTDPENGEDLILDNDLDSYTVYEEDISDTDPNDGTSYLYLHSFATLPGSSIVGVTNVSSARFYSLETAPMLTDEPIWQPVTGSTDIPGSGVGSLILDDTTTRTNLTIYRVLVHP